MEFIFFESIIDVFKFIKEDSTDDDYSISFNNISFDLTKKMSMDDYLATRSFQFPISEFLDDKLRSNRSLRTQKGKKRFEKEAQKNIASYHSQRTKAKEEYQLLVSNGYLLPKTRLEILIDTAHGHSDLESVQAARRLLIKRGYDWQTGEKLDEFTVQCHIDSFSEVSNDALEYVFLEINSSHHFFNDIPNSLLIGDYNEYEKALNDYISDEKNQLKLAYWFTFYDDNIHNYLYQTHKPSIEETVGELEEMFGNFLY